jgi:hypothetical protein
MQAGRWRRTGLLGGVAGRAPWAHSHAALPAAERLGRGWRLYVSTRDEQGRARIGCCALTMEPAVLGPLDPSPVLDLGAMGAFDDSGVTMSCILGHAGRRYLYYTGWTRGVTVPFYLFAGLAISDDEGRSFSRVSGAPILERNGVDPYLTASPFVLVDNGTWRMWYVSGTGWTMHHGQPRHHYHIKYAESRDGVHWDRDGHVCIDYANDTEYAFARPFVMKDGGLYRMWYAFRGDRYAIGYAESRDGLTWTRRDRDGGLAAGADEWESEMVEYPWILEERGRTYLLYNGNDYGRTGVGLAVWEEAG